jgi:hypothetical protein
MTGHREYSTLRAVRAGTWKVRICAAASHAAVPIGGAAASITAAMARRSDVRP